MSRSLLVAATGALAAAVSLATMAAADMSACESARRYPDDPDQQIRLYTTCLESGLKAANRAGAYGNRGAAYMAKGDFASALADLTRSIENDDRFGVSYYNRALVHIELGALDSAEADLDQAVRLRPARIRGHAFHLRSAVRRSRGDDAAALADLLEAVDREDRNATFRNSLAWLLATTPDDAVRSGEAAVEHAERAVELEDVAAHRDTLAAAYAAAGRFDDAVREQTRAIESARAEGWSSLQELSDRLVLYQDGSAFIDDARTGG